MKCIGPLSLLVLFYIFIGFICLLASFGCSSQTTLTSGSPAPGRYSSEVTVADASGVEVYAGKMTLFVMVDGQSVSLEGIPGRLESAGVTFDSSGVFHYPEYDIVQTLSYQGWWTGQEAQLVRREEVEYSKPEFVQRFYTLYDFAEMERIEE